MNTPHTLSPGSYTLPHDCKAFVRGGQVIVSLKRIDTNLPRCRDCRHCIFVKKTPNHWYASPVCKMQPKKRGYISTAIGELQRYYAVRPTDTACDKFQPQEPESK